MKNFNVLLEEETLQIVIKNNLSVARMGDGELLEIIAFKNDIKHPVSKQEYSEELRNKMIGVLHNCNRRLLLCIVPYFTSKQIERVSYRSEGSHNISSTMRDVWINIMSNNPQLHRDLYGSCWFNRVDNSTHLNLDYFNRFKQLYEEKNVILVTGSQINNLQELEMFKLANSIEKINTPEFNAFSEYNEILKNCLNKGKNYDVNNVVFHISAGATGTILASDLTHFGYQALDLGSIFNKIENLKTACYNNNKEEKHAKQNISN